MSQITQDFRRQLQIMVSVHTMEIYHTLVNGSMQEPIPSYEYLQRYESDHGYLRESIIFSDIS